MSFRLAGFVVFAAVSLAASAARAELSLPKEISPGTAALLADPSGAAVEGEPGPREPKAAAAAAASTPAKRAKPRKNPMKPSRVSLDLSHRGTRKGVGMAFRFFDHLDIGYSGILGRTLGTEAHATVFTNLGKVRPMMTGGVPIYTVKGTVRIGARGAAGVEWRPIRYLGLYANVSASYFGKALARVEKSVVMPGAGLLLYL